MGEDAAIDLCHIDVRFRQLLVGQADDGLLVVGRLAAFAARLRSGIVRLHRAGLKGQSGELAHCLRYAGRQARDGDPDCKPDTHKRQPCHLHALDHLRNLPAMLLAGPAETGSTAAVAR